MGRGAAVLDGGPRQEEQNRLIKRDERSAAEKACQPLACQLQACASRYTYAQHKCNALKKEYEKCLKDFVEQEGPK